VPESNVRASSPAGARKNLVSVPDIDASDRNNNAGTAEQSWWPLPSSIQALWEQITASDHCNCLVGTMWHAEEVTNVEQKHQAKATTEITENNDNASSLNLDKSASFVLHGQNNGPATPRTPLQRKMASTPVETYAYASTHRQQYVSPMRVDYLEGNVAFNFTDNAKRPFVTSNPSELSCRSVVTPLIGEHLVSTPLRGEENYENSMMSKASSSLFGEDISGDDIFDNGEYSPPSCRFLPAKMTQKELLFCTNRLDFKVSQPDDVEYELSVSKSQEGKALGYSRSDKILKRVKDRRRFRRNDQSF
jgi:hypothetical protein